jgi:hypothetical protein
MKNKLLFFLQIGAVVLVGHLIAYEMFHIPKQIGFVILFVVFLFYPVVRFPLLGVYGVFILSPFIPYVRRLFYLAHGRPGTDPLIVFKRSHRNNGISRIVFRIQGKPFGTIRHEEIRQDSYFLFYIHGNKGLCFQHRASGR